MKTRPNTLIIDDEANIRFFLQVALGKHGHCISQAETGEQALQVLREFFFDIVILDLNLGGKVDGLRVLEAIRWRWPATVVIILTGHGSLESAMTAIQEGIDGYLLKPVDANALRKAVDDAYQRAQWRISASGQTTSGIMEHADLRLDTNRHHLEVNGRVINLTPNEFNLIHHMMSTPRRVFTPHELVRIVIQFEPEDDRESREIIKWYIHRLRKKIEPDPQHPQYLLNVRGVGYRLGD